MTAVYILVTYDIATTDPKGAKRLRRVAKYCQDYGQRVQNSVFECKIDAAKLAQLKANLLRCIDEAKDSLRIYYLGSEKRFKVEHYGTKQSFNLEEVVII